MRANRAVCWNFGGERWIRSGVDGEEMGRRERGEGRAI